MILAPYAYRPGSFPNDIAFAYGGTGIYEQPFDPSFNTSGEAGMYYDTQLGGAVVSGCGTCSLNGIPTDAELATNYQYTPVATGWVNSAEGYWSAPWQPPNGYGSYGYDAPRSLNGTFGRAVAKKRMPKWLRGLSDDPATAAAAAQDPAAAAIAAVLQEQNQRIFTLTIVSTTFVALSAAFALFRTWRLLQKERYEEAEIVRLKNKIEKLEEK